VNSHLARQPPAQLPTHRAGGAVALPAAPAALPLGVQALALVVRGPPCQKKGVWVSQKVQAADNNSKSVYVNEEKT
jgi:hypothetical protein